MRQTLAGAYDCLTATLYHRASHLNAIRDPTIVPLTNDALPNADRDPLTTLSQSILGSVIGMSRSAIALRDENKTLYENGTLQEMLEKTAVAAAGGEGEGGAALGKKAIKRAMKRERELAKLERRQSEREKKEEAKQLDETKKEKKARKKEKKRKREERENGTTASVDMSRTSSASTSVIPAATTSQEPFSRNDDIIMLSDDDSSDDDGVQSIVTSRSPVASTRHSANDDQDPYESDSRYSIGTPSASHKKKKQKSKSRTKSGRSDVVYVHSTSSEGERSPNDDDDEDAQDDDSDDEDFVLGGHAGDRIASDGKGRGAANHTRAAKRSRQESTSTNTSTSEKKRKTTESSSSDSSTDEGAIVEILVIKGRGSQSVLPFSKGTEATSEENGKKSSKEVLKARKTAFWSGKGKRDTSEKPYDE